MLTIIDLKTMEKVNPAEYKKLTYKTKNNHIYDLFRLAKKKDLNVKIYVDKFVQRIIIDMGNVKISGETFFIENNEIKIYNF